MSRVRRIRTTLALTAGRRVEGLHDGGHTSVHTGAGTDFNDLREYVVGDAVGDIDWRSSARHGSLLVTRRFAERRVTLMLVVATGQDLAAMAAPGVVKRDLGVEAAGILGAIATAHGDHVGMVWWDGSSPRIVPPSNREANLERLLATLETACAIGTAPADLGRLLETASRSLRRRSVVAVVTDDVDIDELLRARLTHLGARHEMAFITLPDLDPTEPGAARHGVHAVGDRQPLAFTTDPVLAAQISLDRAARRGSREAVLDRLGIAHTELTSPERTATEVLQLVRRRPRARR